jgi:hypothetical protein
MPIKLENFEPYHARTAHAMAPATAARAAVASGCPAASAQVRLLTQAALGPSCPSAAPSATEPRGRAAHH